VVEEEIALNFAEKEGAAWITGDAIGKPSGLLSYPTIANASWAWGRLGFVVTGHATAFASTAPMDCLFDAYYGLKAGYRTNSSWLMSSATANIVRKFKDGQGNYLWTASVISGQPDALLGRPVEIDDNMPAVGANAFPIAFGDFYRGYTIVDKTRTRILRDPYSAKPYVMFYATKRMGGAVVDFDAIKLVKCST
jgi:HK97 family phage major capsid protein